jgi:hypothetical protein
MQNGDPGKEACLLLETKLNLFNRYLTTTQKMKAAFGNNAERSLGFLISVRQDLIRKIDEIDRAIKKIQPMSPDRHDLISDKFKGLIAGYLKKLKDIMDTVEPLDRDLIDMVRQQGQSIKTSLLKRQKVQQAFKGYGNFRKYPAKFLDTHR